MLIIVLAIINTFRHMLTPGQNSFNLQDRSWSSMEFPGGLTVKDLVLSPLWLGFDPPTRNFCMPRVWLKQNKTKSPKNLKKQKTNPPK